MNETQKFNEKGFWKIILKHLGSDEVKKYLELHDSPIIKSFTEMAELEIVREYLAVLESEPVRALLAEINQTKNSIPQITEEEILGFDYPVLTGCGWNEKIHAIVLELNKRNLNTQGYGRCQKCDGYHSYDFGKNFCWERNLKKD